MDKEQAVNEMNALFLNHWAEIEKRKAYKLEQISKMQAEANNDFHKWEELRDEAKARIAELQKAAPDKINELKDRAKSAIQRLS